MQYQAQSASDYASNPVKFDATGWTRQGGAPGTTVYVNDKTGELVYVGDDGRIQDSFASSAAANPSAPIPGLTDLTNAIGVTNPPPGPTPEQIAAQQALTDFSNQLQQQRAGYGAGTTAGTAPMIGAYGLSSAPAAAAMNAPSPNAPGTQAAAGVTSPAPVPAPTQAPGIAPPPPATTAAPTPVAPSPISISRPSLQTMAPMALGSSVLAPQAQIAGIGTGTMAPDTAAAAMTAPAPTGGLSVGGLTPPMAIGGGTVSPQAQVANLAGQMGAAPASAVPFAPQAASPAPSAPPASGQPVGTMLPAGPRQAFNAANPPPTPTPQQQIFGIASQNGGSMSAGSGAMNPIGAPSGVTSGGAAAGLTAAGVNYTPPSPSGPSIYGGPAAQMSAAQSAGASFIDPNSLKASPGAIKAPTIAGPAGTTAPTIGAPLTASAQQISQPGAIGGSAVKAQQIGPVGLQGAGANVESQNAAHAMLAGAAAGNAPSAAEALMRKAMDENEGAALGMAATLQGSRPGMALRQGLQAQRAAGAKSAADVAALRAGEQATARQQLAEQTQAARGQDIQAATANLGAQIDTLKANQAAALAAGNTNAANALQAQIATMQGQLDASKANQSTALQATLANQSTQTDVAKTQAAMQMQSQITNLQSQIDVAKTNAANALAAGQSNQAAGLQAQIATMNSQLDAMKANMASQLSTATTNANLAQGANQQNAQLAQNQAQFGATQQLTAAEKNQQAALFQQQLNNQQYMGLTQLQQQALMAPYQAMLQQQQLAQQQSAANQAFWGQLAVAGGTALAASDVTLKTDIAPGAEAARAFLDALPDPVTYRYRDEKAHYPGKQLGVIAQKLPSSVVTTGPDGKKWISANVIGQVLAGLGNVHKRLGQVEETTRLTHREEGDSVPSSDLVEFARKLAA